MPIHTIRSTTIAATIAVLLSGCGSPTLDASSQAALAASLKSMNASLSEKEKQQFDADCMTITMSGAMPLLFQAAFGGDKEKGESLNGVGIFKPLHGLTVAQIHARAEEIRRAAPAAAAPAPQPKPVAMTLAKDRAAIVQKAIDSMRDAGARNFGTEASRKAEITADEANIKEFGPEAWEVKGLYRGADEDDVLFEAPWTARIELMFGSLQCAKIKLGDRKKTASTPPLASPVALGPEPEKQAEARAYKPTIPAGQVVESIPLMGRLLKPGELAVIGNEPASSGAASAEALESLLNFRAAGDQVGVEELVKSGQIFALEPGTPFLVVAAHVAPPRPPRVQSLRGFAGSLQSAAGGGPRPLETLEVRILEGPLEGKLIFVPTTVAGRLIPDPAIAIEKAKMLEADTGEQPGSGSGAEILDDPRPKQVDPAKKAAGALVLAEAVEESGNAEAALRRYRDLVRDYPGTPSAEKAQARIDALTGKPKPKPKKN